MMSEGKGWQPLNTPIKKSTTTPEMQKTTPQVLDAIATTIKLKEHFWQF